MYKDKDISIIVKRDKLKLRLFDHFLVYIWANLLPSSKDSSRVPII
jgi:hypothetical protein